MAVPLRPRARIEVIAVHADVGRRRGVTVPVKLAIERWRRRGRRLLGGVRPHTHEAEPEIPESTSDRRMSDPPHPFRKMFASLPSRVIVP